MVEHDIMKIMDQIEYGFPDEKGFNIKKKNPKMYEEEFTRFYYLLTPEELLEKKCGTCFEQVELERKFFLEHSIPISTYFICTYEEGNYPCHTFLVYEKKGKFYWFEHAWGIYRGIHEYSNLKTLLLDAKKKFIESHNTKKESYTFVYEYQKPKGHISCKEFYLLMEKQKLIKLNEPLYFYHVINKRADLSKGLLSLQYMYDHQLFDLFDKNVSKYKKRITKDWNIKKYQNKKQLTREEILDAFTIFRGMNGPSYIYFFRYPLYPELGSKIKQLLKVKDIYQININDEEVQKEIEAIFYGYENSHSDNKLLDKTYYETVTQKEYFENYDDNLEMNFKTLNHIGIIFKKGYCPIRFLKKIQ